MAASHFSGPVASAAGFQGTVTGALVSSGTDAISGQLLACVKLSMPVTATANTDFTVSIPPGATLHAVKVYTTTAYGAATDITFQLGNAAAGAQYIAATTIKAAGVYSPTLVASATSAADSLSAVNASPNLFVRLVQSGTASATGAATAVFTYSVS
jgi:hypothetical protein